MKVTSRVKNFRKKVMVDLSVQSMHMVVKMAQAVIADEREAEDGERGRDDAILAGVGEMTSRQPVGCARGREDEEEER